MGPYRKMKNKEKEAAKKQAAKKQAAKKETKVDANTAVKAGTTPLPKEYTK